MKAISFSDFDKIRKMTLNEFNRWLQVFYQSAFCDGLDSVMQDSVVVSEDRMFEILLSVKGVGRKRAEDLLQRILKEDSLNVN